MNPIGIAKLVVGGALSVGVGAVVKNAIKATTPENLSRINKIAVGLGTVAIGGIVSDLASKRAEKGIDNIVEQYKTAKETTVTIETETE